MINNVISQALYDSQLQTIAMLKSFVTSNKLENKDSLIAIIDEFRNKLQLPKPGIKPKKDPSNYNLFIRDRINEYKKKNPSYNGHELMRMATAAWKIAHPKNI